MPVVAVDQFAGAALATGTCSSSATRPSPTSPGRADLLEADQRIEGWRATLEAAGADVPPMLVGDWSPRSGYELGRRPARAGGR